ncbi:hypothetical protein HPB49_008378 [Dermacentor silvarum]|uniref:Uncharacterized protein n=1 Tax=Dermacentor silvarum TaxID=543639 RepID=A0ACB8DYH6_DERSI|nr:hypothetical protein HPB49_008378 [Dermacentor silvarum]
MGDLSAGESGFAPSGTPGRSRNMEALLRATRRLLIHDLHPPALQSASEKVGTVGKKMRIAKRLRPSPRRTGAPTPATARKRKRRKVAAAHREAASPPATSRSRSSLREAETTTGSPQHTELQPDTAGDGAADEKSPHTSTLSSPPLSSASTSPSESPSPPPSTKSTPSSEDTSSPACTRSPSLSDREASELSEGEEPVQQVHPPAGDVAPKVAEVEEPAAQPPAHHEVPKLPNGDKPVKSQQLSEHASRPSPTLAQRQAYHSKEGERQPAEGVSCGSKEAAQRPGRHTCTQRCPAPSSDAKPQAPPPRRPSTASSPPPHRGRSNTTPPLSRPECNLAGATPTPRATTRRGRPSRATRRRLRPIALGVSGLTRRRHRAVDCRARVRDRLFAAGLPRTPTVRGRPCRLTNTRQPWQLDLSRVPPGVLALRARGASTEEWQAASQPRLIQARLSNVSPWQDDGGDGPCGFRTHRSTADCLAAVVGTLEQASRDGHAAFLLLLDVQSAFDSMPHDIIISAVRALGVGGRLLAYVRAFLTDRSSVVRVGRATSSPRSVTCGVPQGSVLSPFLFNLALVPISECVRSSGHLPVRTVVYADDVALFVRGPPATMAQMRLQLQAAAVAVGDFLRAIGLSLSAAKSEAIMVHPRVAARRQTGCVVVDGVPLPWRLTVRYLGLTIDHRLTWLPAVKRLRAGMRQARSCCHAPCAVRALLARGDGCPPSFAVGMYGAVALSRVLYALPLCNLRPHLWRRIDGDHRRVLRMCHGLPSASHVAETLAQTGAWPVSLTADLRALGHLERLSRAPGAGPMLSYLRELPKSHKLTTDVCDLIGPDR